LVSKHTVSYNSSGIHDAPHTVFRFPVVENVPDFCM